MKQILEQNREAVREAGRQLLEIGTILAAGKIDDALTQAATARQTYREWDELDQARADIEGVIRDREGMLAMQNVLVDLTGAVIGAALIPRLP